MDKVPEVFDWVTARGNCSVAQMFVLLAERIESDVKAMQAHLADSRQVLTFNRVADDKVIVSKQIKEGGFVFDPRNVSFERSQSGISVFTAGKDGKRALFDANVSLGPEGRCRYEVGDQPLELWQVSRRALEGLFFS